MQAFLKDDSGATAIEYGFIAGLVSITILVSLTSLGANLNSGYGQINDALAAAVGTPSVEVQNEIPVQDGIPKLGDPVVIDPVLDPDVIVTK